ncbi:hypothetical protein NDU88_002559 [Pleurodeles waltl]|uniref:Uncharacterized protein n=1 Tax=Pleurodeles waltl TaxID=8319 RepID=A0AAV7Q710_PLEWA|nr:hypothetical protein NDU88_002559 [Pleurodeles waltl]
MASAGAQGLGLQGLSGGLRPLAALDGVAVKERLRKREASWCARAAGGALGPARAREGAEWCRGHCLLPSPWTLVRAGGPEVKEPFDHLESRQQRVLEG